MDYSKMQLPELSLKWKGGVKPSERIQLKTSQDTERAFRLIFDADQIEYREEFLMILMNRNNKCLGFVKISSGGITGTVVDVRMIMQHALLSGATGIMLAHNHPSGSIAPSAQDEKLTKQINEAGKIMEIKLLDHIIMTGEPGSYYSFADEGKIY